MIYMRFSPHFACALSLCITSSVCAQEAPRFPGTPLIQATGRATQSLQPDEFTISATVESSGSTSDAAFAALAPKVQKLLQNVKGTGIDDTETKSFGPNDEVLFRHYYNDKGQELYEKREPIGYRATYTLQIISRKMDKPSSIATAVIAAEANINNIIFDASNREDIRRKLELTAVSDATERARQMIIATGSKPGRILEIDPPSMGDNRADLNRPAPRHGTADFSFALRPGTIDLEESHTVTLEILQQ